MNQRLIPYCVAKSIYDIEPAFFQKHQISTLFVDLDNTLDAYNQPLPSQEAFELKKRLEALGIKIIVVSNNTVKRVSTYANALGVKYVGSLRKPFACKLKRFIKKMNVDVSKTMMIGDQLVTDVICGNGAGLRVILTEKLVKEDQWTTRFNRLFAEPHYKKLQKHNLLVNWEDK